MSLLLVIQLPPFYSPGDSAIVGGSLKYLIASSLIFSFIQVVKYHFKLPSAPSYLLITAVSEWSKKN